jgi:hypothetical protein
MQPCQTRLALLILGSEPLTQDLRPAASAEGESIPVIDSD